MTHKHDESELLAAQYLAGTMAPDEAADFEVHLSECPMCSEQLAALTGVAERLLAEIPERPVDPRIWQTLRARAEAADENNPQVWKHWEADEASDRVHVHRGADADWEETGIAGIRIQRLFLDQERDSITMRVRMEPGTAYPPHIHGGPEECYVLAGELIAGETVLRSGDYQRCAPGSHHPIQRTETGCELLIVSSLSDELQN